MRLLAGACLCGAVTLRAKTDVTEVRECHCTQCRKQSGHFWAFVTLPRDAVRFQGEISTFAHTAIATRGFCPRCGSFLYWSENGMDTIDISAGILEGVTGLCMGLPAFPESKGDYYRL